MHWLHGITPSRGDFSASPPVAGPDMADCSSTPAANGFVQGKHRN